MSRSDVALLLVMPERDTSRLEAALRARLPFLDLRVWPELGDRRQIAFVVAWNHPAGSLAALPNLQVLCSYGAGVDHLLHDPELPRDLAVTRVVDPNLVTDMVEYVVGAIIAHRRGWARLAAAQQRELWQPEPYSRSRTVLVLGVGQLGGAVARALAGLGFAVTGWSRSAREVEGITCIAGMAQLHAALARVETVVCLLPLTAATRGLLDRQLFAHMQPGSLLVNVGRGPHLVEEDLLAALDAGRPGAAWLDVFRQEPLPAGHPFWHHPCITVTPHVASLTDPDSVAEQIAQAYRHMLEGRPVPHAVDLRRGY